MSIVIVPDILKDTKSFLLDWTQKQIEAGVPKHAICSMAKREFGNGNPLSNRTINRYFTSEYKDKTKSENSHKRRPVNSEKSKVSKIISMFKSLSEDSLQEINQALYESSSFAKNRI